MFYFNARDIEDLDVVQFKKDTFVDPQDKIYFDYEPVGINLYAGHKFNKKRYRHLSNSNRNR